MVKLRQGRKAATLVTGFEQYLLKADDLAEELRRLCASSTSGIILQLRPVALRLSFVHSGTTPREVIGHGSHGAGEASQDHRRPSSREGCAPEVDRDGRSYREKEEITLDSSTGGLLCLNYYLIMDLYFTSPRDRYDTYAFGICPGFDKLAP